MKDFVLVIPARFRSSRLPGKPLLDLDGKSLLLRTYERCIAAVDPELIIVATDDERIKKHCIQHNINVIITSANCLTGTDRVAEVAKLIDAKTYINVQGDEPIINPDDISNIINFSKKHPKEVINGYSPIVNESQYRSRSIPKVVFRKDKRLLYMSRSPIPGNKFDEFKKSWRQICVYAFPKKSLIEFTRYDKKSVLEDEEDIEILRFLEIGFEVRMMELSSDSIAVDTKEDIPKVLKVIRKGKSSKIN